MPCDTTQHNCAETTLVRSYKGRGNVTSDSAVSPRSRSSPGPQPRSTVAATGSVQREIPRGAKHPENTVSHSTATLRTSTSWFFHAVALPTSIKIPYMSQINYQLTEKYEKTPAYHLLHRPNAPIRLGACSHSLLRLQKHFQWKMQANQPWDHRQQLLLSAHRVLSKSTETSSRSHQNLQDVDDNSG